MAKKKRATRKKSGGQALSTAQVKKLRKVSKTKKAKSKKALDQLLVRIKSAEKKVDRVLDELYDALSAVKSSFHETRHKVLEEIKPDTGRP